MNSIRRRLIVLAAAVLACQVAAIAAAPALLYQTRAATDGSELLCDCKVEPGAQCPMHGGKAHQAPGKRTVRVSPVCGDQTAAVLTLLAGGGAILATPSHVIRPATSPSIVVARTEPVFDTLRPPTSPPPRG